MSEKLAGAMGGKAAFEAKRDSGASPVSIVLGDQMCGMLWNIIWISLFLGLVLPFEDVYCTNGMQDWLALIFYVILAHFVAQVIAVVLSFINLGAAAQVLQLASGVVGLVTLYIYVSGFISYYAFDGPVTCVT